MSVTATTATKTLQNRVDEMTLTYYKRLDAMDAYDAAGFFRRLFMKDYKDSARQFVKDVNTSIDQNKNRQGGKLTTSDLFPSTQAELAYGEPATGIIVPIGTYQDGIVTIRRRVFHTDSVEDYAATVIAAARYVERLSFNY